jgi:hypothetical protein
LRGGDGERSFCLKKDRILPCCFFFWGVALSFVDSMLTGISSSVEGAEERELSESPMIVVEVDGRGRGCGCFLTTKSTAKTV